MAHRTKNSMAPLRQHNFSSRISYTTKLYLDDINARHTMLSDNNKSMADTLEMIVDYYHQNVYKNGLM